MKNGNIKDTLTSVDFQELVENGAEVIEIYDGLL